MPCIYNTSSKSILNFFAISFIDIYAENGASFKTSLIDFLNIFQSITSLKRLSDDYV